MLFGPTVVGGGGIGRYGGAYVWDVEFVLGLWER